LISCNEYLTVLRVTFGGDSRHHVTPPLRKHLHWLRVTERISFKLPTGIQGNPRPGTMLSQRNIAPNAPNQGTELCIPVSIVPNLSALRSAARGDLVVPRTRLQLGNRAFCVTSPVAWNSLPLDIRSAPTLSTFKNMLKTFLTFLLH